MSSLRQRLASVSAENELAEASKVRVVPTGWEPGVVWSPELGGTLTAGPYEGEPDPAIWAELIKDWGLDPSVTEVVPGSVQVRAWDANLGKTLNPDTGEMENTVRRFKYYRATLRPNLGHLERLDFEALYQDVRKAKPGKKVYEGKHTFLVCLSDWQIGNPDGLGVDGQLRALAALVDAIPDRVKALRKLGYDIGCIAVAGLGDLGEGCSQFYSAQPFRVEIDRREQGKVIRRGLRDILMAVAPLAPEIKVICVPGNHGENRQNGKAYTRVGDNDDVAVFEAVAEILAANPEAYGHVKWRIPDDEIAVSVDLSGKMVSFTHGHVPKAKGNAAETAWHWWKDQSMGRKYPGVADSEILIMGHYHHFCSKEQEGRTVFVTPSLTEVSEYFSDYSGMKTRPGTLSMVIGPTGWSELTLL